MILKQTSLSFSVNKFFNDLKSQRFSVAKMTVHDYLAYIEDAYLAFSFSENLGRLFENLVYLDLRRRGHEIYYYLTQTRHEVDFVTRDKLGKLHLYQVIWNIDDIGTMERETRALREAEKELKIKGSIITPAYYLSDFAQSI